MKRLTLILASFLPLLLFAQIDSTVTLVIKDKTQYSPGFLKQLGSFYYSSHYQLKDSLLIVGQLDTAYFPTELPLGITKKVSGSSNGKRYEMNVTRINYSTIRYHLDIFKGSKLSESKKGQADIGAGFFLGAESDYDDKTGVSYLSSEYADMSGGCVLSIRIGKNHLDALCIKLSRQCETASGNIKLEDCPILREK